MTRSVLILAIALATALPAAAHVLPNQRYDRTVYVRLAPTAVTVKYALELSEWTLTLDANQGVLTKEEMGSVRNQRELARLYAEKKARLIADNLRATLNGEPLSFTVAKTEVGWERDHPRLELEFRAPWSPAGGGPHVFTFRDDNFEAKSGQITLTLAESGAGLDVVSSVEPTDLRGKSPLEYKPGDDDRARRASAEFTVDRAPEAAPEPTPPPPEPVPPDSPSLWDDLWTRGLVAVFDSGLGLGLMLLLAALFGTAHAFTPGHGKTMVAAYLVGERGTVSHAVVLGLVATAAHTGSVIGLAVVVYTVYGNDVPAEAQGWLMLAGGLLIAAVGLWLFLQRVRGRADHVHLFAGHHHHHGDGHHHHDHDHHHYHGPDPSEAKTGFGWARVVLLGVGGGIIPCWDAVLLLLVALTRGKVGLAIPLLIAFSAGLAGVLIALGIGVVYAHRSGGRRFGDQRWFKLLPVLTAGILVVLGLWFARDGVQTLSAAHQ